MPIVRRKPENNVEAAPAPRPAPVPVPSPAPLTIPVPIPKADSSAYSTFGGMTAMSRSGNHRGMPTGRAALLEIEQRLHGKIISELRDSVNLNDVDALVAQIERLFNRFIVEEDVVLNRVERGKVFDQVCAEIMGYGPIQQLLNNDAISEIMVNGPHQVWIEQEGKLTLTDITFKDEDHVMRIITRIVAPLGRRVDESSPMVDARLPDGSRVNAIIPPLSLIGPVLTVRKFRRIPLSVDDLLRMGSLTQQAVLFLEAVVRAGLNVLVTGGTGSGKTTLLNVLSSFIPADERIVTIEDAAELQLQQVHVIPLESRPPSIEGHNAVAIRDLVINCLRMRPDRIVVGECRGKEAFDMLQAMNTGHDGCMTTIHANSPRDALSRMETMVLMASSELPLRAIRDQIAAAFDIIIHVERMEDGSRKVSYISEVQGMENDTILMQDVFHLDVVERDGQRVRELVPTGIRPQAMRKIERARIFLAPDFFLAPSVLGKTR
jgi:pilus assembly protein CpaF